MTTTLILMIALLLPSSSVAWGASSCAAQAESALENLISNGPELPHFSRLHPEAQAFWSKVGEKFTETMNSDFRRPSNIAAYRSVIEGDHPHWRFLKSLGFTVNAEGVIEAPPFPVLLDRLLSRLDTLNAKLEKQGDTAPMKPRLHFDIKEPGVDKEKYLAWEPLVNFSNADVPEEFEVIPRNNVLSGPRFARAAESGEFPVGGIEIISPPGVERKKLSSQEDPFPLLMDFLHDLSHVGAFIRNPKFVRSYQRVYRTFIQRAEAMGGSPQEIDQNLKNILGAMQSRNGIRIFLFSESAWVTQPGYAKKLNAWPTVKKLLSGNPLMGLSAKEKSRLLTELKEVRDQWWHLFEPLGGTVNDTIFLHGVRDKDRVPLQKVWIELTSCLNSSEPLGSANQDSLARVLGLLGHSKELSIEKWERFATTEDFPSTKIGQTLQKMFPSENLARSSDWSLLNRFLYGK